MSQVPGFSGYGYNGMPSSFGFSGPTPYPGSPALNASFGLQHDPRFDGMFAQGLTTSPYINSLLGGVDLMQTQIFNQYVPPLGYPPLRPQVQQPMPLPPNAIRPSISHHA